MEKTHREKGLNPCLKKPGYNILRDEGPGVPKRGHDRKNRRKRGGKRSHKITKRFREKRRNDRRSKILQDAGNLMEKKYQYVSW